MAMRFRKSIKLAPGVRLNLGKSSAGISIGGKGLRYSINTRGRSTTTIGIPGTGISYSSSSSSKKKRKYKSASYAKKEAIQLQKIKEQQTQEQQNRLLVEEYEAYLDILKNVHSECEDEVLWENIKNQEPPFPAGAIGPNEKEAQNKFDSFKPNFLQRHFSSLEDKKRIQLQKTIATAHEKDTEDFSIWQSSVNFATRIINGDIDAYYEAIEEAEPFNDLLEYGSGFEVGTDTATALEVEFAVKSNDVVPTKSKSLTKAGKLSEKNLSKTAYYDIMQDYVCSCSIRIARELFALLPITEVVVHATDNVLDTTTGHYSDCTILSVKFIRSLFDNINFDNIDASDFVETFEHHMKFKKTMGFSAIERI